MIHTKRLLFIVLLGFVVNIASCQNSTVNNNNISVDEHPIVVIPNIPDRLDFAGEKVPLDNYDTMESLEEDMSVTMYMHSRTLKTLRSAKRYFSVVEPILKEMGIPEDFKYLAMAESGLNPEAYSSAKAAGLWQILSTTGKEYGLEVGTTVDERYDIEKSTRAACKYLKKAYEKFGSWTLAAASYNAGMSGVSRRVDIQKAQSYYDTFLPSETMRYVFRILSFKIVEQSPKSYGFMIDEDKYYKTYEYKVVDVSDKNIIWSDVAKKHGTNYKILREMNPWIRDYTHANVLGKKYKVKIPVEGFRSGK